MKKIVKISEKYPKKERKVYEKITFHKLGWLEWGTLIIGFWFLIYPDPYYLLLTVLLIIPVAGILINGFNSPSIASLVDVDIEGGDDKYDVADFIDAAAIFLVIRMYLDYKFESISSLILPGLIGFGLMILLLFLTHEKIEESHKDRTWIYFSLIFNIFLYSYAATYAINCAYDSSAPQIYQTEVLDKANQSTHRKRRLRYAVTIAPWGNREEEEEVYVSKAYFESLEVGGTAEVKVKEGLLKIPWYYLE